MIAYALKKTETNGEVSYERHEMKYWSTRLYDAAFFEKMKDVEEDLKYHQERDENYAKYVENYQPPKYEIIKVELNEIIE